MEQTEMAREASHAALKMSPTFAFAVANVVGWGPEQWAYVLIGLYSALQSAHLLWKWRRERKNKQ